VRRTRRFGKNVLADVILFLEMEGEELLAERLQAAIDEDEEPDVYAEIPVELTDDEAARVRRILEEENL
jgi:hypothetical protein